MNAGRAQVHWHGDRTVGTWRTAVAACLVGAFCVCVYLVGHWWVSTWPLVTDISVGWGFQSGPSFWTAALVFVVASVVTLALLMLRRWALPRGGIGVVTFVKWVLRKRARSGGRKDGDSGASDDARQHGRERPPPAE